MRDLRLQPHHSVSLCDALDQVFRTGVVALGEVTISVADIDLLYLGLQLVITSIGTDPAPRQAGHDWPGSGRVVRGGPRPQWDPPAGPVGPPPEPPPPAPAAPPCFSPPAPHGGAAPKKNGLAQLVLTLIKVLHELLERQAVRRMEAGSLSIAEMERLGLTLQRQGRQLELLAKDLGLEPAQLNLDLGPLGKLCEPMSTRIEHSTGGATLADLLERILDKGIVIAGDIKVKIVDIELLTIQIRLLICSVDKARQLGVDWWVNHPAFAPHSQDQLADAVLSLEERLAKMEAAVTAAAAAGASHGT